MLWSGLKKRDVPRRDLHAQLPAAGARAAQMRRRAAAPLAARSLLLCGRGARRRRKNTASTPRSSRRSRSSSAATCSSSRRTSPLNRDGALSTSSAISTSRNGEQPRSQHRHAGTDRQAAPGHRHLRLPHAFGRAARPAGARSQQRALRRRLLDPARLPASRSRQESGRSAGARATPGTRSASSSGPRIPNDPELAREGLVMADADLIFNRGRAAADHRLHAGAAAGRQATSTATSARPGI